MYYRLKYGKNYLLKIVILTAAALAAEIVVLQAAGRPEDFDIAVGQVNHIPWAYAVTKIEDGRIIVGNISRGFEITLPADWQVRQNKHPSFYLEEEGDLICEIKSDVVKYDSEEEAETARAEGFTKVYRDGFPAGVKEAITAAGNLIYETRIYLDQAVVKYILFASKPDIARCRQEYNQIMSSWLYYE